MTTYPRTTSGEVLAAARRLLATARQLALAEQAPGGVQHDHADAPGLDFMDCPGCRQRRRALRVLAEIDGGGR